MSPARHGAKPRTALALALLLALAIAAGALLTRLFDTSDPAPPLALSGERIAYLQFDVAADSLWLVDPARPQSRQQLATLPHARDFGAVPSIAPDRQSFLYNILPPEVQEPTADSPAQLWLLELHPDAQPRQLAENVDLLVPPVWSHDGRRAVVRRSGETYSLVAVQVDGSGEQVLVESADSALFPVGFAPDGSFFYVELNADGSHAAVLDGQGAQRLLTLSLGLTRDWVLSPDGTRLAYLELSQSAGAIASQAFVADLRSLSVEEASSPRANAFGPTWDPEGALAYGSLTEGRGGSVLSPTANYAVPRRGFDVPLAFAKDGRLAVRSFDGVSLQAPGNVSLSVIDALGRRQTIATGEVTFLGWTNP